MPEGQETDSTEKRQEQAATPRPNPAAIHAREAEKTRKRQALLLQRERILSERTSNPHRRSALTNALADIEEQLAEFGWTVHL